MKVFFDANCLFSAVHSSTGAAYEILRLAYEGRLEIIITEAIFNEASRNLTKKAGGVALSRLGKALSFIKMENNPSPEEEARWCGVTIEKDCHVLAGALNADADVLITFDKKHLMTDAIVDSFPIPTVRPGEFLAWLAENVNFEMDHDANL